MKDKINSDYLRTMPKRIIVSVSNDLSHDQRVHKVCLTLQEMGFEILLVGRMLKDSRPLTRSYSTHRVKLLFNKGPLFYAELNLRLFFYLLFKKSDVLVSNDLDTLLSNYLAAKIKGKELVYDTHEYFTEVPELQHSPLKKKIWRSIEAWIFPKLKNVFTVNASIAGMYEKEYGVKLKVVRNVPFFRQGQNVKSRVELGLPLDKKIVLLQGAWINIDRGGEEAVLAMKYIENAILLVIGGGDALPVLKKMVEENHLHEKVNFISKLPYEDLQQFTSNADIGLSLDKGTNPNYLYSLPNKLFDYIQAGVPVLASDLPEIKKVIKEYKVGEICISHDPLHISEKIKSMINNNEQLKMLKENCRMAARELCWENEKRVLKEVYAGFL